MRTIFDVGIGFGTPELYRAFPECYFVLVEPLRSLQPYIDEILNHYNGEFLNVAAGSRTARSTITVDDKIIGRSSIYQRAKLTQRGSETHQEEIQITTLDSIISQKRYEPPFGLKIDTEGGELEAIRGATAFLRDTQFVIAEVSIAERFDGSYAFADFVETMKARSFELEDILYCAYNSAARRLVYADCYFRRAKPRSL